jgi:hypothetical protein
LGEVIGKLGKEYECWSDKSIRECVEGRMEVLRKIWRIRVAHGITGKNDANKYLDFGSWISRALRQAEARFDPDDSTWSDKRSGG